MAYSPPAGNAINFNLTDPYSAPTGDMINFNLVVSAIGIKQLVVKSTATPGYVINSINIEYIDNGDILYINTANGTVRVFSLTCSGTIDNRNIVSSDYEYGSCNTEKIAAGYDTSLIEINVASGTEESFEVVNSVSKVLYYTW